MEAPAPAGIEIAYDMAEVAMRMRGSRIYSYVPNEIALPFHRSKHRVRLVKGGNGSGKTEATMAELAAIMQGPPYPPWLNWDDPPEPPFAVWVVTQKFPKTKHLHAVTQKLFLGEDGTDLDGNRIFNKPFISPHLVDEPMSAKMTCRLTNGVVLELKSADQDVSAFESVRVAAVVVDEPISNAIYEAIRTRLVRVPGARMWMGMTPYDMVSDYLYDMMRDKTGVSKCFTFPTYKNPYMPKQQLEELMAGMSEETRKVRIEGELVLAQGTVYPYVSRWPERWSKNEYNTGNWRNWSDILPEDEDDVPFEIPKSWTRRVVHDPGIANPAAAAWFATDPSGNIWVYRYYYDDSRSANIREKCEKMLEINAGDEIKTWYIDPFATDARIPTIDHGKDAESLLKMYRSCGIAFVKGPREQSLAGRVKRVEATKLYLEPSCTSKPMMWFLPGPGDEDIKREFELYVYEKNKGEKNNNPVPRRKHDHLMYCIETAAALGFGWSPSPRHEEKRKLKLATGEAIAAEAARNAWLKHGGGKKPLLDAR